MYFGTVFELIEGLFQDVTVENLLEIIPFEQRQVKVYGKVYPQPRLTKWYGPVAYRYSGLTWEPAPMPELVQSLLQRTQERLGTRFNSVLANLYRDGNDTVGWHSDNEPLFGVDPEVASLSFGAKRVFQLRKKSPPEKRSFELDHGSLFFMGRGVQREWQHHLPRVKDVGRRINLTFRLAQ